MAEKDTKSKSTAKSSASAKTTAKPATKSTAAKTDTAKTSTAKTTVKSEAKTTASKSTTSKSTTKATDTTTKSASKSASASKAAKVDAKPVSKTVKDEAKASTAASKPTSTKANAKTTIKENTDKEATASKTKPKKDAESPASSETKSKSEKAASAEESAAKSKSKKTEESVKAETPRKTKVKGEISEYEELRKREGTKKKSESSENISEPKATNKSKSAKSNKQPVDSKKRKKITILISAVSIVLMVAIIIGIVLGAKSCNANGGVGNALDYPYKATTPVGYSGRVIGNVTRVKPVSEMRNGGLEAYPEYGKTLSSVIGNTPEKEAARNALIYESSYLTSSNTWNGGAGGYTWMDKNGYLYSGTTFEPVKTVDKQNNHRQLYKHTTAVGLYGGDVADDEPAIIKEVTLRPRGYNSYSVTGLYAPAGEVIKIQLSEKDMEATGGITIHIGQALYNGKANNIWTAKNQMQRFPVILNTMVVNKDHCTYENGVYTAYVGSFVGGPIYVRNTNATVKVTISGGVPYSHFILGYTTPEEFAQNLKSSAPYFDLEVWNCGVLLSGPKMYSTAFSYDDLYKAAVLWEKVTLVTTTNSKQGIVFLFDPFVAAGAAVAFPGQGSVNCPTGWMAQSLNYKSLVTSGAWGNFHEYHHNFQGYGVGAGGEVTNNGMTLVSYALFTKVSAARSLSNYGAAGLGGWNRYTSAPFALEQALRIGRPNENPENGDRGLSLYATLLHNFGPDNYIQAKVQQQRGRYGQSYAGYLRAWQEITHNNMSYYFNNILNAGLGDQYDNEDYPMFIPVSSTYQTGRTYTYDGVKKTIKTMQPYTITYGEEFTLDFRRYENNSAGQYVSGSIVVPDEFNYTIKSITQPQYGELVKVEEGVYTYKPDKDHMLSGEMKLTLGLSKVRPEDTSIDFPLEDVELIIELQQSRESNKYVLNRDTYFYDEGKTPTDAIEAFNSKYAGYKEVKKGDNINKVQNSNTDVWYNYTDNQAPLNSVVEIRGKMYVEEAGKYRIALRGRYNVALFVSLDGGKTYELAAHKNTTSAANGFDFNNSETYKDYELKSDTWLYFKEVMINDNVKRNSFVGLGWGMFIPPQGVIDENGNIVGGTTEETISVRYATAYREDYEFQGEFETDYFYRWEGKYNYSDNRHANANQTIVSSNYNDIRVPENHGWGNFPIENLIDGNKGTYIHTIKSVSESAPLEFTIDMGSVKPVNRMTIYSQYRSDLMSPKSFNLYGSNDGENFFVVGEFYDLPVAQNVVVRFEEKSFRYYKLVVTQSHGRYVIIGEIELKRDFELHNGEQFSPSNEKFSYGGGWDLHIASSTFGSVYVGKKNSSVSFQFEGTRFAILSSKKFGTNFEVYVDGKRVSSLETKPDDADFAVSFLSPEFSNGKHNVTIKCKGEANIDSIVTFPEQES